MLSDERRAALINQLRESGYVQAAQMAQKLQVSTATIRRDLALRVWAIHPAAALSKLYREKGLR